MKKLFFIAAIASVAFAGCTKNDPAPSVTQQDEITFLAPVVSPQTKAQYGEIGVNYDVNEHFGVYAVHTPAALTTWDAGTLYMGTAGVGLECLKNGGENYWAPATPYYWPKEGFLSFAAYSPFGVSGTVTYGGSGLKVIEHKVSTDTDKHIDFMYAPRVYNRNSSTEEGDDDNSKYKYDGVNILFEHAMSSIVIKVAKKDDLDANTKITLKEITITKPYMTADFKENVSDGATYTAAPAWSNWKDATDIVTYATPVDLTTTLTEYVNTDDDVILIPQTLTDDVKIVLDYDITTPGLHKINQVSDIQLNAHTPSWGMGTRYIYSITIDLDEIIFDPAVTAWDETGTTVTF